jgi:hypothetical protein
MDDGLNNFAQFSHKTNDSSSIEVEAEVKDEM